MEAQRLWPTVERRHSRDRRTDLGSTDLHKRVDQKLRAIEAERRSQERRHAGPTKVEARLSLKKLAEVARAIAVEIDPGLEVIGVTGGKSGSAYVEILLRLHECDFEPCRISLGADRTQTRQDLEQALRESMRGHLQQRKQQHPH